MPDRGTGARGVVVGIMTFGVVLAGGAVGVRTLLGSLDVTPPEPERCAATLDGTQWYLAPDQAETAALLSAATVRRGMPARAATIALATGLQESKLRNIDYGDRDSVGIFQQRPSQGWGTVEQIMDPVYSTAAFLDALEKVDGYEALPVTVAAQTVQRSAFPDAYAQHEVRSRAWASGLTGHSPAVITCTLHAVDDGDPAGFAARAERDLGLTPAGPATASAPRQGDEAAPAALSYVLDSAPLATHTGDEVRAGWVAAQWAVAVADAHGVLRVEHDGMVWERDATTWRALDDGTGAEDGAAVAMPAPGTVTVHLAAQPVG